MSRCLHAGQNSLYATRAFKGGDTVHEFHALATYPKPNMYTLQASASEHIDLGPAILQYTNHSCTPTVFFNTTKKTIEALVDIAPGDQVSCSVFQVYFRDFSSYLNTTLMRMECSCVRC